MVDLGEIQAAYYMVAATGVLVAAIYYVYNMRVSQRNMKATLETRKLQLLTDFTDKLSNYDGALKTIELLNMQWKDYDDFERKYGSDNNPHNCACRSEVGGYYNVLGALLREKIVDPDTLYTLTGSDSIYLWSKMKEVIEYARKNYFGVDYWRDFEYLAGEMLKIKLKRDPSFKVPESFISYVPEKSTQ